MVDKGVSWNVGRVFFGDEQVYSFDLLPEAGPRAAGLRQPAAVLRRRLSGGARARTAADRPALEQQGRRHRAARRPRDADVETPDGDYRSPPTMSPPATARRSSRARNCSGQESKGRMFRDRFLIADVKMDADLPAERWFWFDPPFHPEQSCCCTGSPTTSGASTSSSAGTPIRGRRTQAREHHAARVQARCSAHGRGSSSSNGPASTRSPASAWSASAMDACCSRAMRRMACRLSARAARTPACRTPTTSPGSWPP